MAFVSMAAGSLAGVWVSLAMMSGDGAGTGSAIPGAVPVQLPGAGARAQEQPIKAEPCDDLPHQAAVLGCAHAQQAAALLDQAPPPPGFDERALLIGATTDVQHYFLDITITHSPANITGSNTMTVKVLQNGVTTFGIQLHQNFTISSMTVNN